MDKSNLWIVFIFFAVVIAGILIVQYMLAPPPVGKAATPTEAYKQLWESVQANDIDKVKQVVSKATMDFAKGVAAQRKITVEEVLKNGMTRSTINEKLPALRDERVKGKFGAVEAFSKKDNKWEDVRFVMEDGGWKLAVGELWKGTYKSPGKSRTIRERENANAAGGGPKRMANVNTNVKPKIITPDVNKMKRMSPSGKPIPQPPKPAQSPAANK